jgi:hypothetical protein
MKTITIFFAGLVTCALNGFGGDRQNCMQDCQRRYQDKVNLISKLFNSSGDNAHYHNLQWQKESLDAAKSEFDSCRATCQ